MGLACAGCRIGWVVDPLRLTNGLARRSPVLLLDGEVDIRVGVGFAIVLVYFLIVVNSQSWLDSFIIITALLAALAGIIVFLLLTHTVLSVPALMGAIMCMGVGTANSILAVAFATDRLASRGDPLLAAIEAGFTRFRPVLMTALAMIIGMIPMAAQNGSRCLLSSIHIR